MFEGLDNYDNGPGHEPEKVPRSLREVVAQLQDLLTVPENYMMTDDEKHDMGTTDIYALEIMAKTEILDMLQSFIESLELGRETPETLKTHTMFKAIYTKALAIQ